MFLAVVPMVLAYTLAWLLGQRLKHPALKALVCGPLALVWLAFLPNTCYLLTEWRHLLFDQRWAHLLDAGNEDREAMLRVAKWALLFLAYSGVGVLLFVLAVRPMEHRLRAWNIRPYVAAPFFFFLMSLGVYLGLIVRFNSWDLIQRPAEVWEASLEALTTRSLLISIGVFALLLWGLYESVDIWVDGVAARLGRGAPSGPGKAKPKRK